MTTPDTVNPGMELYGAMIHARQAAEYLLVSHHQRRNGHPSGGSHYYDQAMNQLHLMAADLGLEVVKRHRVAA